LLGLGLNEFSMNPVAIPKVKKVLRMARFEETLALAEKLFQFPTASEIECYVRNWMAERFPGEFIKCYTEEPKA
jgi:phosphoenolpyruvate-protein phosphotransferase (PTS system enzyme I)